jgi:hypothetical protein
VQVRCDQTWTKSCQFSRRAPRASKGIPFLSYVRDLFYFYFFLYLFCTFITNTLPFHFAADSVSRRNLGAATAKPTPTGSIYRQPEMYIRRCKYNDVLREIYNEQASERVKMHDIHLLDRSVTRRPAS